MFSGKSMAIALPLPEKCDCLKLWFGKPIHCKNKCLFIAIITSGHCPKFFSRFTNVIIGFIHFSDSRLVMVLNTYHVLGRATWAIIGLLLWLEVDFHYFLQQGVKTCLLI